MTNREKLEDAGILKKDEPYTPEEEASVESLTDEEIDLIISQGETINTVVDAHLPVITSIGTHHLVEPESGY